MYKRFKQDHMICLPRTPLWHPFLHTFCNGDTQRRSIRVDSGFERVVEAYKMIFAPPMYSKMSANLPESLRSEHTTYQDVPRERTIE